MKKGVYYSVIFSAVFVILLSFILAAGTSSGGYRDAINKTINKSLSELSCEYEDVEYAFMDTWKKGDGCNICKCAYEGKSVCTKRTCNVTTTMKESCEKLSLREDRILCRLRQSKMGNYTFNYSIIPEACRNETFQEKCQSYYAKIRPCYTKEGEAKLACFRRLSGLSNAALNGQGVKKAEMRDYVIALLYDLEQRAEDLNEDGKLSDDDTALMITQITTIKTKILEGANASEVRPLMQELKTMWKNVKASEKEIEDEDDDSEDEENETDDDDSNETESDDDEDDDNSNLNMTDDDDDDNETEVNNTGENNESN